MNIHIHFFVKTEGAILNYHPDITAYAEQVCEAHCLDAVVHIHILFESPLGSDEFEQWAHIFVEVQVFARKK